MSDRSKQLAYLLRHKPEKANLALDKEGWCSMREIVRNTDFSWDELIEIVKADEKNRYTIRLTGEDGIIRANQGHSTSDVKLTFKKAVPPVILYHGTTEGAYYDIINKKGILKMSRHHVHLSVDKKTAEAVGARRKQRVIVLSIDCKKMLADGHKFFLSDNGVWLVDEVPARYIVELK